MKNSLFVLLIMLLSLTNISYADHGSKEVIFKVVPPDAVHFTCVDKVVYITIFREYYSTSSVTTSAYYKPDGTVVTCKDSESYKTHYKTDNEK